MEVKVFSLLRGGADNNGVFSSRWLDRLLLLQLLLKCVVNDSPLSRRGIFPPCGAGLSIWEEDCGCCWVLNVTVNGFWTQLAAKAPESPDTLCKQDYS